LNILSGLKTFLWTGFCASSCLFISCEDDTSELGSELQNPNDKILVFNDSSMQLNTFTAQRRDIIKLGPDYFLLGYQNDSRFGSFQNNFMTEVGYQKPEIEGTPIIDSIRFYLHYAVQGASSKTYPTIYGDSTALQTINMYELRNDIALIEIDSLESTKDNIDKFVDRSKPLGTFSFYPKITDTIIRITLPAELGERLLDTAKYSSDSSNISSLYEFQKNIFRGIYFEAQPISETGAITTFTVSDSTGMHLFYHDDSSMNKVKVASYYIYSSSFRCNTYGSKGSIKSFAYGEMPLIEDEEELIYIKNSNAYKAIIQISDLQKWADSADFFTINKASILLETDWENSNETIFSPVQILEIYKIIDNDYFDFNTNYLSEYIGTSGYGYISYTDTINIGYKVNIKETLFNAIRNGEDKLSLVLTTPKNLNLASATRTVLKGAKNAEQPLKLHITYTKLNEE
jgi:hypothetical protein